MKNYENPKLKIVEIVLEDIVLVSTNESNKNIFDFDEEL
jgi:hypothetical protein